ncbi:MAG TPA: 2-oxo acid dehydrogenase subunit E2 [Nocardioides sp.]|jgi:pyruvate dehydrogenase E2 component (dihydrolipoamide acetyltransferase)
MSRRVRGWRRLAGGAWDSPRDPQFFGDLEVDAGSLMRYADEVRERTGVHVTMTHLVGRAVAHALVVVPDLRLRVAFGREFMRPTIDVFFIVASVGGQELTGVKIERADEKPAVELARELSARTAAIHELGDPEFGRAKRLLTRLPRRLVGPSLRLSAWLTADLRLDLPRLGMRRDSFGGAMVTSVGMWGIEHAYSPLASYYRVPVLVLVGAVTHKPVAVAGQVVVRPMLGMTATFDHRYVDGFHAASFAKAVREYCADPAAYEPPLAPASARDVIRTEP